MGDFNNIIEAALALLVTFLIGCIIGWFLRAKIFRNRGKKPQPVSKPVEIKVAPLPSLKPEKQSHVTAPVAKIATAPKPVATKPNKPPVAEVVVANPPAATDKPSALKEPRDGIKDDLKKIVGVGPKLEGTLNGLGIFHFDQIAKWTRKEIIWVDDYLSFKGRIDRDDWVAQAKKLK